jgi:hypothetical protein
MRIEIREFEPSRWDSDGSQTLQPSNRLNRRGRRFNRRFVWDGLAETLPRGPRA